MSDHGVGLIKKFFNLNSWLRENGYLKIKNSWQDIFLKMLSKVRFRYSFSAKWKSRINRLIPGLRENIDSYISFANIDWANTKAFSSGAFGNIYINVEGEWGSGIVKSGIEYEQLREELSEKIRDLRDPEDGESVVEKVYKREEIYRGPYLVNAPDLVVQIKDYKYLINTFHFTKDDPILQNICNDPNSPWPRRLSTHRLDGVVIFSGEMIENVLLDNAEIIDLAPTILYLMNLPIPIDMDGKVLTNIFSSNYLRKHPVIFESSEKSFHNEKIPNYTSSEEDKVKKMLQGLGYID